MPKNVLSNGENLYAWRSLHDGSVFYLLYNEIEYRVEFKDGKFKSVNTIIRRFVEHTELKITQEMEKILLKLKTEL